MCGTHEGDWTRRRASKAAPNPWHVSVAPVRAASGPHPNRSGGGHFPCPRASRTSPSCCTKCSSVHHQPANTKTRPHTHLQRQRLLLEQRQPTHVLPPAYCLYTHRYTFPPFVAPPGYALYISSHEPSANDYLGSRRPYLPLFAGKHRTHAACACTGLVWRAPGGEPTQSVW